MRTLTQVWVFFVSLTLVLLFAGFQLGGRRGLFISFIVSLVLIYATLHRGLALFKKHLNIKEQKGNDTHGFLKRLNQTKKQFGMKEVHLHYSNKPSPSVCVPYWSSRSSFTIRRFNFIFAFHTNRCTDLISTVVYEIA